MSVELKTADMASADIMLGRSVDNLFDANDTALPHTGSRTAISLDLMVTGLTNLSSSPMVPVHDAVSLLTRPHSLVDRAHLDARQAASVSNDMKIFKIPVFNVQSKVTASPFSLNI